MTDRVVIPRPPAIGLRRRTAPVQDGLPVDLTDPDALIAAARTLPDPERAFPVWCEAARLTADPDRLDRAADADLPADVRRLLLLRRAALGHADAKAQLRRGAAALDLGPRAVVLVGPAAPVRAEVRALLDRALAEPAEPTRVFHTGAADGARGFGPAVEALPGTGGSRERLLTLWTAVLAAGLDPHPRRVTVRALVLPAAPTDHILLLRALGATIGWPQLPDRADLSRSLPDGAACLVPLPDDPMTVRAFLRPGRWPAHLTGFRDAIAAELHRRYVARQRGCKPDSDPALHPWARLSPRLRESSRAQVDDIPNKLAAIGLRLDPDGPCAPDAAWPECVGPAEREHLAELEHGRFTAERLQSGWVPGARDAGRLRSPYLVPWSELDDTVKQYDRDTVDDLPSVLGSCGIALRSV